MLVWLGKVILAQKETLELEHTAPGMQQYLSEFERMSDAELTAELLRLAREQMQALKKLARAGDSDAAAELEAYRQMLLDEEPAISQPALKSAAD